MIEVCKTGLETVLLIKPSVFTDHRGEYIETYNEELYKKHGISIKFVQDDISISYKNVLRGIHGDEETWKLVSCLHGKIYYVVVNCDKNSNNFGKWQSFELSDENRHQILIPPKHGGALLALTDKIIFYYKQSTYYNPGSQFTYKWDDPRFNISWPVDNPILSERDKSGHSV